MLFRQMLREHLFLIVGYQILLLANAGAAIAYWPELRANIDQLPAILKLVPSETLRQMLFMMEEQGYWAYFGVQQLFKGGGVAAMIAGALLGSLLIAREVDTRTAELLFSRPISRTRIFVVRWASGMVFVQGPFLVTTLAAWAAGGWVDEKLPLGDVLLAHLHLSTFVAAVFTVTSALSTFADHQLKPALIVIGLLLLQMAIYMVMELNSFSVYKAIDLDLLLPIEFGTYPLLPSLAFVAVTLVALGVGVWQMRRRDF